jgi:hypothetical protein
MDNSKKFLGNSDFVPFISFKENNTHTVKLIDDKESSMKDQNTGDMKKGMKYLVEEGGAKKSFFTGSLALISKLSEYKKGDVVTIKMVSKKGANGFVSSYEVYAGTSTGVKKQTETSSEDVIHVEDGPVELVETNENGNDAGEVQASW